MARWRVEVRYRDTSKPGGWSAWHMLAGHVYARKSDADADAYFLNGTPLAVEYRVRRYDRRKP